MVYNQALVRYALEGLLLRISLSHHADRFVLKGAMLYVLWQPENPPRATRDLDLLCFDPPDLAGCREVFHEFCQLGLAEPDGLQFDLSSVQAESIRQEDLYGGIRITLTAQLDSARIPLQIDLGFGDHPVPEAVKRSFPALLRGQKPQLRAYAPETVIAEKLHAMVERGLANSRYKDFFDISYLAHHFEFQSQTISAAIRATFQRRGREFPTYPLVAWTPVFYDDPIRQRQWLAFLRKANLSAKSLPETMTQLETFLRLPLAGAVEGRPEAVIWRPGGPWSP
jgi:hypothetical protein